MMNTQSKIHQQAILDSTGLLPQKNWKTVLLHIALLIVVVFLTEISGAQADMVFDFQMKLAKKGNAEAQFKVGEMYETGRGVEKNEYEAKRWINMAAAQGNKAAGYNLLYKDVGKNGITKDNKAELVELQNAAKDGDGYAQYYVGLMHSRGVGVKKNNEAALDWLGKASLVGITAAESEIARVNESSQGARLKAKQDAERRARQQQEAKRQQEERRKLEAQRKQQEAMAKKKAEEDRKHAQQREAERKAAAEAEAKKQRLIAQKEAEAEKKRQAVLAQREKKEAEKKTQFESDPCSGKSARFLSTCR